MAYRAILFDVGDTLWHSAEAPPASEFRRMAAARAAAFFEANGIACEDPDAAARVAWDALEDAMRAARASDRREPDYAAVARTALGSLGIKVTTAQAGELMEAIYISGEEGGKAAYPDARKTLEALRLRGFKLGIVTNRAFGGRRFRDDIAAAGLDIPWDSTVVSVEAGYLKPHPKLFEQALKELGVRASEAVMVGNSLAEDVAGAQAMGIAAAWKRSAPDAESVTPDFVFDDVSELLDWSALKEPARA